MANHVAMNTKHSFACPSKSRSYPAPLAITNQARSAATRFSYLSRTDFDAQLRDSVLADWPYCDEFVEPPATVGPRDFLRMGLVLPVEGILHPVDWGPSGL